MNSPNSSQKKPNSKSVPVICAGVVAITSIAVLTGVASNAFVSKLNADADKAYAATVDVLKAKQLADWQASHGMNMSGNVVLIPEIANIAVAPTDIIEIDGKFYINSDLVVNPDGTHSPNCPCYYCKYIGSDGIDEGMIQHIDNKDYILIAATGNNNGNNSNTDSGSGANENIDTDGNDGYPYLGVDYISIDRDGNVIYVIQRDETLSEISSKIGYSVDAIAEYNGIRNVNMIYEGSCLRIPVSEETMEYFKNIRDNVSNGTSTGNYNINLPVDDNASIPTHTPYIPSGDSSGSITADSGVQFNANGTSNGSATSESVRPAETEPVVTEPPVTTTPVVTTPTAPVVTPKPAETTPPKPAETETSTDERETDRQMFVDSVDVSEVEPSKPADDTTDNKPSEIDTDITGGTDGHSVWDTSDVIIDDGIGDEPIIIEDELLEDIEDDDEDEYYQDYMDWYVWYYWYCYYRNMDPTFFDPYAYFIWSNGGSYLPDSWYGVPYYGNYDTSTPDWYDPYWYAQYGY